MKDYSPFVVLSLPRSRSFWLSRYLSIKPWHCAHDELIKCRSLEDVRCWFKQPFIGTCETAGSPFWRLIPHYCPTAQIATIRRPVNDVLDSCGKLGFDLTDQFVKSITLFDRKLDQLEKRLPDVIRIDYDDLNSQKIMKNLTEKLLNMDFMPDRFKVMSEMNLQTDITAQLRYYSAYENQIKKLAKTAKQVSLSLIQSHETIDDGMLIQEESLESVMKDGIKLFQEHAVDVGEHPDSYLGKNIPLMQKLEELGNLQIHTVRCNGRLFGYLAAVISPSMERQNTKSGVHTLFYTSRDVKNIGVRLQKASIDALKRKGCDEVILRAGIRGSAGGRIASLYRRLGAEDFGQLYRLDLG